MRLFTLTSALLVAFSLAGCDNPGPTASTSEGPLHLLSAEPPEGGGGGGGGDAGGGTGETSTPTFRLYTSLDAHISYWGYGGDQVWDAVAEFQRYNNGSWERYDTQNITIRCYINDVFRDGETESNASRLSVEFKHNLLRGETLRCDYSANNGQYASSQYRTPG